LYLDSSRSEIAKLDVRVGKILKAENHPTFEGLYVEEIDVGEDKPRIVVSGLAKFVPLDQMQVLMILVFV
jgi:tRNA-binding EMAP/Myf-like protein